jgi:hypothetical protein
VQDGAGALRTGRQLRIIEVVNQICNLSPLVGDHAIDHVEDRLYIWALTHF